ncbi:MAG: hypothetical protein RRA35_13355 [Desulfomonilia bacterium]|nr:hypothetical protein [Desulfomonilia bacterium]
MEKLDAHWHSEGVEITWHDVNTSDDLLADAEARGENPCRACHRTKRTYLFSHLATLNYNLKDIVLVMSFPSGTS